MEKLSAVRPDDQTKQKILSLIAEEHKIKRDPNSYVKEDINSCEDLQVSWVLAGFSRICCFPTIDSSDKPLTVTFSSSYMVSSDLFGPCKKMTVCFGIVIQEFHSLSVMEATLQPEKYCMRNSTSYRVTMADILKTRYLFTEVYRGETNVLHCRSPTTVTIKIEFLRSWFPLNTKWKGTRQS